MENKKNYANFFNHSQIFSTKVLGKRSNAKLKSVTILHSQTTETVRLPDGGDGGGGQVTVHPALRSKLPLKRKVRNGRLQKKRKGGNKQSANNNVNSPTKSKSSPIKKKKNRVGAEEVRTNKKAGETAAVIEIPPNKVKKAASSQHKKQKKAKKKEVIDYSGAQAECDGGKKGLISAEVVHNQVNQEADPVGKVQNWLLKSHNGFPKSKSTPERLTEKNRSPHRRVPVKPTREKSKSHSVGNIAEKDKVRLQVVYKPPFKFSVKLRKPDKVGTVVDRSKHIERKTPRTAVLVRTVREKPAKPAPKNEIVEAVGKEGSKLTNDIDLNSHTVQSDLEVLLSENELIDD